MKKWLWVFLAGMSFTVMLLVAGSFLSWYLQSRPPEIARDTTLILDLEGEIPEQPPTDIPGRLFEGAPETTFLSLLQNIEKAEADSRIQAILIKPRNLQIGWAKLQQLRQALEQFSRGEKKVLALLGVAGSKEYFLATAAETIYLSPVGILNVKGMQAEVMFFKDALAKLGVQADLEHIGRYKSFSEVFTDNRMSDAFREATESLLDSVYGHFINTVAGARRRSPEEMRSLIEQSGPFEAERAKVAGLVDELRYEDEILEQFPKQPKDNEPAKITLDDYRRVPRSAVGLGGGPRIALVYAVGSIAGGEDNYDPVVAGKILGAKTLSSVLEEVAKDETIRGVVVRIDSPGGDAFASDEIWRSMNLLREKKPLVVSMSDTAASGGYYMAMTGDPIVAEPGTITGSIGIVYGKVNLKGLYDKIGINQESIRRGPFAGMDSAYGPYTPEERQRIRAIMEDFYRKFLGKVAVARKMTPEAVDELAQGRVWTGEQAQRNGLVDELGGLPKALEILKKKAGIAADAKVQLVEFPRRKSLFELLLSRAQGAQLRLPALLTRWLSQWDRLENLSRNPLWAWLPASFDFR